MSGGLDAYPSLSRMKELYRERTGQELKLDGVVQTFVPAPVATRAQGHVRVDLSHGHTSEVRAIVAERLSDGGLRLVLPFPPRTKKNGTTLGIRQKQSYRNYRDAIITGLAGVLGPLGLPLPEADYNIAAIYYVDRGGEQADKCGLDQGLYDALENAGVVTNDWQFRTDDGTRIVAGDPSPRVELVITPLQEGQHG